MWSNLVEAINHGLNEEDGFIIRFFGDITERIFTVLMMAGVPFLIYLFFQFLHIS
jgi:hypothetical protein